MSDDVLQRLRELHEHVVGERGQRTNGSAFVLDVSEYSRLLDETLPALLDIAEAAGDLADKLHVVASDGKRRRRVNEIRVALARLREEPPA